MSCVQCEHTSSRGPKEDIRSRRGSFVTVGLLWTPVGSLNGPCGHVTPSKGVKKTPFEGVTWPRGSFSPLKGPKKALLRGWSSFWPFSNGFWSKVGREISRPTFRVKGRFRVRQSGLVGPLRDRPGKIGSILAQPWSSRGFWGQNGHVKAFLRAFIRNGDSVEKSQIFGWFYQNRGKMEKRLKIGIVPYRRPFWDLGGPKWAKSVKI